jgi:hypothetical protein
MNSSRELVEKSKETVLGIRTGLDTTAIGFLDARRRANAQGEHYQALLRRDRLGQKGGYRNE